MIGLKISHAVALEDRYTAISTNWQSNTLQAVRINVFQLTRFLTCNQRLSSTVLSSRPHFFSNGAPNDTDNVSPEQYSPNFPKRCADKFQKWSNSLQYTGNVSNHMLCSNGDQSLPKKIEKLDFLHLFLCSTFPLISQKRHQLAKT